MESPAMIIETIDNTYVCDSIHFTYDDINHWQNVVGITTDMDEVNIPLIEVRCIKPVMTEPIAVISLN